MLDALPKTVQADLLKALGQLNNAIEDLKVEDEAPKKPVKRAAKKKPARKAAAKKTATRRKKS